jgi:hypothetical protein
MEWAQSLVGAPRALQAYGLTHEVDDVDAFTDRIEIAHAFMVTLS